MTGREPGQPPAEDAGAVLERFWAAIDRRDWDALTDVLAPDLRVRYVHTGEVFTADEFVRVNREYPGEWAALVEELVVHGDRAVSRTRVSDGSETYFVASFAGVRDGMLSELTEVWTGSVDAPPADRRPSGINEIPS